MPSIVNGRTVINDPQLVPLVGDDLGEDIEQVVVYVDELPEGDTQTLKAVYRLLNERKVNDSDVHPRVRFLASGNQSKDGALTEKLIPTVANRLMHVVIEPCYKEWIAWATSADISPVIRAFIGNNPSMLQTYDPASAEDAFATPRTYARLDKYMGDMSFKDTESLLARGAPVQFLGSVAGKALLTYVDAHDIPDLQAILADPLNYPIEQTKPGAMFLLGQSLVSCACIDNITAVLQVLDRMPPNHKAINFMAMNNLPLTKLGELMLNTDYLDFLETNKGLMTLLNEV